MKIEKVTKQGGDQVNFSVGELWIITPEQETTPENEAIILANLSTAKRRKRAS